MRKIEVPSDEAIKTECARNEFITGANIARTETVHGVYAYGYKDAIAYANTQLQTAQEHKRPFLSDDDIEDYSNGFEFTAGAKWARDRYEDMLSASGDDKIKIEQWKPEFDALVIGWGHNYYSGNRVIGWYKGVGEGGYHEILDLNNDGNILTRKHVAAIESSDEIGKPPSYFVQRGRCTVSK